MMSRKKLFTVILTGITALMLFAGCASDADSDKEVSVPADTQSEEADTAAEESAEAEDTPDTAGTEDPGDSEKAAGNGKVLVVYYSASGNTERVAGVIADTVSADIFKVEAAEPYSDADLDWTDKDSRVSVEHENENEREVELVSATVDNWDSYDTVFVGYPIWWGIAAWPLDGFVKANDFTGKTVIPFCTSSSSDLGDSGKLLADMAGTGEWQTGQRFRSSAPDNEIQKWVQELGY